MISNTHHTILLKRIGALLLIAAIGGCSSNGATESAPTTTSATTTTANSGSTNSASTGTSGSQSAASFAGATATWTKITAAKADLDKIIVSKKLASVHEAAFKVRDIVRTLPAQSRGLSPDKANTLATQVKNVDQLASKLDEAGDSNNLKATQDNQAGLGDTLDTIKDLYPSGTFK